jgi:Recombination directionality factor-like
MSGMGMGLGLPQKFRELGRLRPGMKGSKVNQKGETVTFPKKLTQWRITTKSAHLARHAAEEYGGQVAEWCDAPAGSGTQWEVFTTTDTLEVLVPPDALSQSWELWSGAGCSRRCNGVAMSTGEACQCPADLEERLTLSKKGQACKPTSRLNVVLFRLPDIGVFRCDAHGVNAAMEWPATVALLDSLRDRGQLIPALLRIDPRVSMGTYDEPVRHYLVPVLELPSVTIAQLQESGHAGLGAPVAAISSAPTALDAGPVVDETEAQDEDESGVVTVADLIERVNALPAAVRGDCVKAVRAKVGAFPKVPGDRMADAVTVVESFEAPEPSPKPSPEPPASPTDGTTPDPAPSAPAPSETPEKAKGKRDQKPPSFPGDPANFWQPDEGPKLPLGVRPEWFEGSEGDLDTDSRARWDAAWTAHGKTMSEYLSWRMERDGRTPEPPAMPLFDEGQG